MPYQSHKRARKREKLSTHKLWPQRRTVNPQKQCAADEKAQRSVIVLAARKDEQHSRTWGNWLTRRPLKSKSPRSSRGGRANVRLIVR